MTEVELTWVIGTGLTLVTVIGGMITRDRQTQSKIDAGDNELHERINRVRDEYVKRADLDKHLDRISADISDLRKEIRNTGSETTKRLDQVIAVISKQ